jgi:hypothetical protein
MPSLAVDEFLSHFQKSLDVFDSTPEQGTKSEMLKEKENGSKSENKASHSKGSRHPRKWKGRGAQTVSALIIQLAP